MRKDETFDLNVYFNVQSLSYQAVFWSAVSEED